jgi:hypothetical protein
MSKGFFTIAQGDEYVKFAYALALSLKISQFAYSKLSIGITPGYKVPEKYVYAFDEIIEIPWGDAAKNSSWKLENEWKVIYMSPYDETIKLDADMLFNFDITEWWNILEHSDVVFTTQVKTYRNSIIDSDYYRKVFTQNNLPNVYTAFFYFNKSDNSFELFKLAEHIYNNWQRYFFEFLKAEFRPDYVSTDLVFAIASKILNIEELNQYRNIEIPTFVHMKTHLQKWHTDTNKISEIPENWNKIVQTYFTDDCDLFIGNYKQIFPFHYHVKDFITDGMIKAMESKI